jgi:hypothetical protein
MKQVIGAEIKVDSKQAEQSVGNFKKALKDANTELVAMTAKFGATSKEAINAAQRVAGLRDAIGDARSLADSFNPDQKFAAFGGAVQGVVAGFSALQGTMALFGTQSKEVEETLLKVQSAMALSQGLSGVFAAVDSFKNLGAVIKSSTIYQQAYTASTALAATVQKAFTGSVMATSVGFKILRTAIISTGIGALIVGIGLLISKIEDWTSSTEDAEAAQKRLADANEAMNDRINDQIRFMDDANDMNVKRARLQGKSEKDIYEIQLKGVNDRIALRKMEIEQAERLGLSTIEITRKQTDDYLLYDNMVLDFKIKTNEKLREQQQQRLDDQKSANDKLISQQKAYNKAAQELEKELGFQNALNAATEEQKELMEEERKHAKNLEILKAGNVSTYQAEIAHQIALKAIRDKYNPPKVAAEEGLTPEQKEQIAGEINLQHNLTAALEDGEIGRKAIRDAAFQDTMTKLDVIKNATTAFASLIGEQTAAGKALGIATALINTYQGATEVLRAKTTLPEPFGTIQKIASMAAVIASGIKAVKAITAVKVPGKGGGGVSVPSVSAPALPQARTTSLDQSSINGIGNAASGRAFVLDRDIEGNRERAQRLNRAARIN